MNITTDRRSAQAAWQAISGPSATKMPASVTVRGDMCAKSKVAQIIMGNRFSPIRIRGMTRGPLPSQDTEVRKAARGKYHIFSIKHISIKKMMAFTRVCSF